MILHFSDENRYIGVHDALDVVCVGLPVIKVNKPVYSGPSIIQAKLSVIQTVAMTAL